MAAFDRVVVGPTRGRHPGRTPRSGRGHAARPVIPPAATAWLEVLKRHGRSVTVYRQRKIRVFEAKTTLNSPHVRRPEPRQPFENAVSASDGKQLPIVIKRMAYGYRDDAYFFLKIRQAFSGNPG
jgi:hypothetical protein